MVLKILLLQVLVQREQCFFLRVVEIQAAQCCVFCTNRSVHIGSCSVGNLVCLCQNWMTICNKEQGSYLV